MAYLCTNCCCGRAKAGTNRNVKQRTKAKKGLRILLLGGMKWTRGGKGVECRDEWQTIRREGVKNGLESDEMVDGDGSCGRLGCKNALKQGIFGVNKGKEFPG